MEQIINSYKLFWANFANFNGRTRRRDYWYAALVNTVIVSVLELLGMYVGIFGILASLFSLISFIPTITIGTRRLHDIGKSGWWQLIMLTGIGAFVLLFMACIDSKPGDNQYGPNPKGL
ncbi:MAG: DUF805 domain-containing protein [Oscillospiraceae bacterium]|nr:DUF805 domain-containing protein [Oscillospiraceae bacterium]